MMPSGTNTTTPSLAQRWGQLDATIRTWWDADLVTAREADLRADPQQTLLFLPAPYSTAAGSAGPAFPEMYAWDTHFINLGLLAHDRPDLVRQHLTNYLFLIDRYGFMPNGNRTFYLTRSQTPVMPDSLWRYYEQTQDRDLLMQAYPLLVRQYRGYWTAAHHQTPTGLATNRDLGDPSTDLSPELFSHAETGLDFCALFGPDIRHCTPLITNCALVRYAQVLAQMATVLALPTEAQQWTAEAQQRTQRIRDLCWDDALGFFFEYDFVAGRQLPFWSNCAYWALWAGVATPEQATRLVAHLPSFLHPHGLAFTDVAYPSPYPEFTWMQWGHPAGWPPMHVIVMEGLDAYGFRQEAEQVATNFVTTIVTLYEATGQLYEKYNVVEGSIHLPHERYDLPAFHGWTAATAVLLGQRLFARA